MSNGYNDYKIEMESFTEYFERDGKLYKGVKFVNDSSVIDVMSYQFCDLMCEDAKIVQQIRFKEDLVLVSNGFKTKEEVEEESKVAVIQVGTENYNYETKQYDRDYEGTLYVFHNDYLMCGEDQKLFVVDENYIKEYNRITEKEFVQRRKNASSN